MLCYGYSYYENKPIAIAMINRDTKGGEIWNVLFIFVKYGLKFNQTGVLKN